MYRLTVDGDETYMIVTRNVFSHRLSVYKKYDLKVGGTNLRISSLLLLCLCIYIDRKMVVRLCGLRVISLICLFFQGSTVAREASDKEKVPSPVTCQHHS